jgi:hypothetical protein
MVETDTLFERYCKAHLPLYLRDGRPPDYAGTEEDWAQDRAIVVSMLRSRWAAMLEKGLRPAELVGDAPWPEVYADGSPVRPPAPGLSSELEAQANAALMEVQRRGIRLAAQFQIRLERAANRQCFVGSDPEPVEKALNAARAAISRHDAEVQAAQAKADSRPWLNVLTPFRFQNTSYAPGEFRIEPARAQELRDWEAQVNIQADKHGGHERCGFPIWPVFQLEGSGAVKAATLWKGA